MNAPPLDYSFSVYLNKSEHAEGRLILTLDDLSNGATRNSNSVVQNL